MGKGLTEIRSLKRKHQPDTVAGLEEMMQTSLEAIAKKAKRQKAYRFGNLYRLINEELLMDSWTKLNKLAAMGADKISAEEYGQNLAENICQLVEKLKKGNYHAKLVRRHYIPKRDGKMRPLGIPAVEDKLLQYAVLQILQAIFEGDLLPSTFGYRPNRGAKEAVNELQQELWSKPYQHVVEADIKGYFDSINHEWMVKMLEERIHDRAFIRLIKKWLKAGVLEPDGKVIHPVTGTPQGGIISPMLANIYMHYCLNLWFEKVVKKHCKGLAYLCVYADDFVAAFQHKEEADAFYRVLGKRLAKFSLSLSPEKTRIVRFSRNRMEENGAFEFLGFEYRWKTSMRGKAWIKRSTSKKRLRNSLQNFKVWAKENNLKRRKEFFSLLNSKLRGYYNYYGVIGNLDGIGEFYYRMTQILFKALNRRSQRRSYTWNGFSHLLQHFKIERPHLTDKTTSHLHALTTGLNA